MPAHYESINATLMGTLDGLQNVAEFRLSLFLIPTWRKYEGRIASVTELRDQKRYKTL